MNRFEEQGTSGPDRPSAVILAAGASRRMGSPKALLPLGGETFLDRLIRVFRDVCDPVIVVLGHHAEAVQRGASGLAGCVVVQNPNPERGQLSSLQHGLRAVPDGCRSVMFTPVDYPAILDSTVVSLTGALHDSDALLAVPRYQGRHGHPIALRRSVVDELAALREDAQARDVVHAHRGETVYVDVNDPGVVRDVDDPEAYQRLVAALEP